MSGGLENTSKGKAVKLTPDIRRKDIYKKKSKSVSYVCLENVAPSKHLPGQ